MKANSKWISVCGALSLALGTAHSAWCIDVDVAEAPTTDLQLTLNAINSAQSSLYMNIYELSSPEIADALIARIQAGVKVQILEEGQPVGGMSTASKGIVSQIVQAMQSRGDDRLFEMTSKAGAKRRFHYDHAKYVVIDETTLLVGSENYSPTGNPQPGSVGNRGWEVMIHDATLAQSFETTFVSDSDTSHRDVMDITSSGVAEVLLASDEYMPPKHKPTPTPQQPPTATNPPVLTAPAGATTLTATEIDKITSPDTSLSGLKALLESATTSIDIEQMSFDPNWGTNGPQSPLLDEVLAAAKRGVKVRVLLNDETVFDHESSPSKPKNRVVVQMLNDANSQGLPVQALVADIKAMGVDYIHNKGVIVDGNKTLISSINWDENAVEKNREAAVLITSTDIYNHYEALFQHDWDVSSNSQATASQAVKFRAESAANYVEIDSVNCPSTVNLMVDIGAITVEEGADQSFRALANQHYDLNMSRDKSSHGCIFMTSGRTGSKKVLEIRQDSQGLTVFILEGYTAKGKLYSIRAKTDSGVESGTDLSAIVYDGSGPAKEKLGEADMVLRTE